MDAYVGSVGFSGLGPSQIGLTHQNTFRYNSDSNKKASSPVARACFRNVSQ